ncbi:MAG: O-antigen polymerase family protein, partial [Acidobacteria bacterium]|nr:O-antigen polymerase family protein [Acidobacteriota bacterium]
MSIRLFLVYLSLPVIVLLILRTPFWGMACMIAYYSIRPDIWGAPAFLRPAFIFTLSTFVSFIIHFKEEKGIHFDASLVLVAALGIWMLATSSHAQYSSPAAEDAAIRYLKVSLQMYLAASLINTKKRVDTFFWIIVMGMLWLTKSVVFQYLAGVERADPLGGTGSGGNSMATVLGMTVPFLCYKLMSGKPWERFVAIVAIPCWIFDVVAIGSRGAFIGFGLAMTLFLLMSRKKLKAGLIIAAILIMLSTIGTTYFWQRMSSISEYQMDTSSANRLQMWRAALERAKHRPVLGIGTANFAYISDQELRMHSRYGGGLRVHNAFLELLAENGIPGLLLYLLAILITLNYLRKSKKLSKRIAAHDGAMLALCLQIAIIVFLFRGLTGSNQGDDVFYYFLGA